MKIAVVLLPLLVATACGRSEPSAASRMASDCREQLKSRADIDRSAEWRPGPIPVTRRPDGAYLVRVSVRRVAPDMRVFGLTAECVYHMSEDSVFTRYSFAATESQVVEADTARQW